MIKSYSNYIKEEFDLKKFFKKDLYYSNSKMKKDDLNDVHFDVDPFNEEDWGEEDNYFKLILFNMMSDKIFLQLIDIKFYIKLINSEHICEFIFQNNRGTIIKLVIALKNKKWSYIHAGRYIQCVFYDKDEANQFIYYLNKNHKDSINKLKEKGEFDVDSIFRKMIIEQ
jgi:hypothetical protein